MISKPAIKFVRQLHQKKYRNEHKLFIVEGDKITRELLNSSYIIHSLYGSKPWLDDTLKGNERFDIVAVSEKELGEISLLETPNKVLAIVQQPAPQTSIHFIPERNYLLLDAIRDPGNMGTILRIADWFGIDQLVLSPDCVEIYNPKVVQSSMGSILRVNFVEGELAELLSKTSESKRPIVYGAVLSGKNLYDINFDKGSILVIGNESSGLSENLKQHIGMDITIPSFNATPERSESLNAAIATAVCCAEICRQQRQ